MSNNQNNSQVDLNGLLSNFRDLDYVVRVLINDIASKNKILKSDLDKYETCRKKIDSANESHASQQSEKKFYPGKLYF